MTSASCSGPASRNGADDGDDGAGSCDSPSGRNSTLAIIDCDASAHAVSIPIRTKPLKSSLLLCVTDSSSPRPLLITDFFAVAEIIAANRRISHAPPPFSSNKPPAVHVAVASKINSYTISADHWYRLIDLARRRPFMNPYVCLLSPSQLKGSAAQLIQSAPPRRQKRLRCSPVTALPCVRRRTNLQGMFVIPAGTTPASTPPRLQSANPGPNPVGTTTVQDEKPGPETAVDPTIQPVLEMDECRASYVQGSSPLPMACMPWVTALADERPETRNCHSLKSYLVENVNSSDSLRHVIQDDATWYSLVHDLRVRCMQIERGDTGRTDTGLFTRLAMALYFASLDAILNREVKRLRSTDGLTGRLVKNGEFHKSLLAISWECAIACSGVRDMRMLWFAMNELDLSPFALTKVLESFSTSLVNMPRHLMLHMLACDARILECLAWKPGSELVVEMQQRRVTDTADNNIPLNEKRAVRSKEFAIEMFYKKLLSLASTRTRELLLLLQLDNIDELVWTCVKHCVWSQWHLMVARHLDHIIMCSVYAVAKVRLANVQFRAIVAKYRMMNHVCDESFSSLVSAIVSEVPLKPYTELNHNANVRVSPHPIPTSPARGDIIMFYNQVFIFAMKSVILNYGLSDTRSIVVPKQLPVVSDTDRTASSLGLDRIDPVATDMVHIDANQNVTPSGKDTLMGTRESRDANATKSLEDIVLRSPMQAVRRSRSQLQFGRVTVSAVRQVDDRGMSVFRQSPNWHSGSDVMTPGTRRLYAFGESPLHIFNSPNHAVVSPQLRGARLNTHASKPRHLSFETDDLQEKSIAIKRRYRGALGEASRSRRSGS